MNTRQNPTRKARPLAGVSPFLLLAALCAAPAAQNVIIVDSQNRPGTQFTDLEPAVQFAQPGDILLVRDGSYMVTRIAKGLQIHALPGAVVDRARPFFMFPPPPDFNVLVIENIPAGESVTIKGLQFGLWGSYPLVLRVENCLGPVLLEDVVTSGLGTLLANTTGLVVKDAVQVALARCRIVDRGGMFVDNSTVVAHDSQFHGNSATRFPPLEGPSYGVWTWNSAKVFLSRCDATGGHGQYGGASGISLGGSLSLTGVVGTTVTAGGGGQFASPVSAIRGTGSLTLDPIVTLVPGAGAPPVGAGIRVTTEGVPSLSVTGAPLGGQVRGDLRSGAGEPFAVLLGLPAPILVTPFGRLWVDPTSSVILASGTLGAGGTASWTLSVPNVGTLLGVVLTYQGAAVTPNGLRLSNPGQHVLDA